MAEVIDRLQIGIAPHKNLHPEILSRIFYDTLPDDFSVNVPIQYQLAESSMVEPSAIESPWSLGHVCQRWRDISVGQTGLWRKIRIVNPRRSCDNDALMTILSRSRPQPIELDIKASSSLKESLLPIISPHASRILRLALDQHDIANLYEFLHDISASGVPLHSLKDLQLYISEPCTGRDISQIDTGLSWRCPMLQKVHITLLCWEAESSQQVIRSLHLPSGTLTELNLNINSTFQTMISLLTENPQLEKFMIDIRDPLYPLALTCITLAHLRYLSIAYESRNCEPTFLAHLTLPALCTLDLFYPGVPATPPSLTDLINFMDRSKCQLQAFNFGMYACQVLDAILERNHNSLLRLSVLETEIDRPLLQFIARGGYTTNFLRNAVFNVNHEDFEDLLIMLENVWLREVHITNGETSPWWDTAIYICCLDDTDMEGMRERFSASMAKFRINGSVSLSLFSPNR
jgi:hypothetical protein